MCVCESARERYNNPCDQLATVSPQNLRATDSCFVDNKLEAHDVWEPESKPISVEGVATVMPAGLLSILSDFTKPEDRESKVLQVNSAYFELDTGIILNRESDRLWMTGKLRDASGSCSASLTSPAVCDLFQVSGKDQALDMKSQGNLVSSLVELGAGVEGPSPSSTYFLLHRACAAVAYCNQ